MIKKKKRRYKIFTSLMIIKDYLHLIDMAKDKTVLQMLGFLQLDKVRVLESKIDVTVFIVH